MYQITGATVSMRLATAVSALVFAGIFLPLLALGSSSDRAVSIDPVSEMANPLIYPADASGKRLGGTVTLMVKVGANGVAENVRVFESSGVRSLDKAAIKAAYMWSYLPAVKDDRPIEGYAKIPISFPGTSVQRAKGRTVRKRFVTRNDPVFGDYVRAAEARVLAKGNELHPEDARKNHPYGSILTTTCIRRDGSVADVAVLKGSGIAELDNSIVESTRAAAPFEKLEVDPDGPDQLCITATYEYARAIKGDGGS